MPTVLISRVRNIKRTTVNGWHSCTVVHPTKFVDEPLTHSLHPSLKLPLDRPQLNVIYRKLSRKVTQKYDWYRWKIAICHVGKMQL